MVGYIIGGNRSYCDALGTCSLRVCRYMGVWQQVMLLVEFWQLFSCGSRSYCHGYVVIQWYGSSSCMVARV